MVDCVKILIVDDTEMNRSLFLRCLKNSEYELHTATNGKIGIEKVKEIQPDLIIMDMEMPVMSGYEAVQILRDQGYRGLIVAWTASIKPKSILYSQCDHIILKPFRVDDFMETIKNLPIN